MFARSVLLCATLQGRNEDFGVQLFETAERSPFADELMGDYVAMRLASYVEKWVCGVALFGHK